MSYKNHHNMKFVLLIGYWTANNSTFEFLNNQSIECKIGLFLKRHQQNGRWAKAKLCYTEPRWDHWMQARGWVFKKAWDGSAKPQNKKLSYRHGNAYFMQTNIRVNTSQVVPQYSKPNLPSMRDSLEFFLENRDNFLDVIIEGWTFV